MTETVKVLQLGELPAAIVAKLQTDFELLPLPGGRVEADAMLAIHGAQIRGMVVRRAPVDAALMQRLPALEVISSYTAGLDGVDLTVARRRGISVHNTSHVLAEDVADLAVALVLASSRGTVRADHFVRGGHWLEAPMPLGRSLRSLQIGIVGLGQIGSAVARRLVGMGAEPAYAGPTRKAAPYRYFPTLEGLAGWGDMLILTCPATAETHHLVSAEILSLLGPAGHVINVSRGTVLDQNALVAALAGDRLAGAALDVFEDEPRVPDALLGDPRVVLSPHIGSSTHETRLQMGLTMIDVLRTHFGIA